MQRRDQEALQTRLRSVHALGMLSPGLSQSLIIAAQRRDLTAIGAAVGTPVIFLKGAWADPVLYGGRGERTASDIDVLVRPECFEAFGARLCQQGFVRHTVHTHPVMSLAGKEQSYRPVPALAHARMPIDLHHELANESWYSLPPGPCIDAALEYESPDGPILSLCPTDQVLYAAAHYANHTMVLDDRHLSDLAHLLESERPWRAMIDWDAVVQRAAAGHLTLALVWVARRLRRRGVDLPPMIPHPTANDRTRLRAVHVCAGLSERLNGRYRNYGRAAAAAILCGRPVALPRFILRYARLRAADFRARLLRR